MPETQYIVVWLDDETVVVCQPVLRLTKTQAAELARNLTGGPDNGTHTQALHRPD